VTAITVATANAITSHRDCRRVIAANAIVTISHWTRFAQSPMGGPAGE